MPKLSKNRFRALRAEADWSTADLATTLGMTEGSLRNAEGGREPMSDRKIHRAARAFTNKLGRPVTYNDLVDQDAGDGVPDSPPPQPPSPPKPPRRKERGGSGPKRAHSRASSNAA